MNEHCESFIRKQLEFGRYNNASEVGGFRLETGRRKQDRKRSACR
ncbi:type II toxin-antitoxin system ParD family antitoxin [Mesorhizobium sp. Cs1321R2N1]